MGELLSEEWAATDLVAPLPDSLVDVFAPRFALRRLETPLGPIGTTLNLVWHDRTHQDRALRAFRDLLAGLFGRSRRRA